MFSRLPKAFRNFYVLTTAVFLIWMLVLDSNNLIARFQLSNKLDELEDEKEYYQEKIQEVEKDREALFGDQESIETFAREKYLMKKKSEDIYIIVEE